MVRHVGHECQGFCGRRTKCEADVQRTRSLWVLVVQVAQAARDIEVEEAGERLELAQREVGVDKRAGRQVQLVHQVQVGRQHVPRCKVHRRLEHRCWPAIDGELEADEVVGCKHPRVGLDVTHHGLVGQKAAQNLQCDHTHTHITTTNYATVILHIPSGVGLPR